MKVHNLVKHFKRLFLSEKLFMKRRCLILNKVIVS